MLEFSCFPVFHQLDKKNLSDVTWNKKKNVLSSALITARMDLCKQKLILKFAICMWQNYKLKIHRDRQALH